MDIFIAYEWHALHEWDATTTQIDGKLMVGDREVREVDIFHVTDEEVTPAQANTAMGVWKTGKVMLLPAAPVDSLLVPMPLTHQHVYEALYRYLTNARIG